MNSLPATYFLIKGMMACNASGFCNSFFGGAGSLDLCPVLNLEEGPEGDSLSGLYTSTCSALVALLGVQDSSQCSSRGY